jgi:dTDP-glucose 4,6-dehydratase
MNLLVTGGAGFSGSGFARGVLTDALPALAGARVTVLDKLTYAGNFANLGPVAESKRLDFVPGDITDAALIDSVLPGHDAVVHFAAESHAGCATTNVAGTQVLLDAALRHGTGRFVQVSTGDVYGPISTGAWTERSPLTPVTPYAATKAGADLLALAYHRTHGLPVVVMRCADTYGPYQHPEKLIPGLVTSLLQGRTVSLNGDQVRDRVHVDDVCRGTALALLEGRAGEVYHIGGGREVTDRELMGMLLEAYGAGWDRVVVDSKHGGNRRYALDDEKIRQELGYRPRVDFTAGVAETVQWYRDNEEWWRPLLAD